MGKPSSYYREWREKNRARVAEYNRRRTERRDAAREAAGKTKRGMTHKIISDVMPVEIVEWEEAGFRLMPPGTLDAVIVERFNEPYNVVVVNVGNRWGVADYHYGRLWLSRLMWSYDQRTEPTWAAIRRDLAGGGR